MDHPDPRPGPRPIEAEIKAIDVIFVLLILVPAFSFFIMRRVFSGGTLILDKDGVTFICRGDRVHCPWKVFATSGKPRKWKYRWVVVPVSTNDIFSISYDRNGGRDCLGESIQTRHFRCISNGEVALKNIYRSKIRECCQLLSHIGRNLSCKTK
jgi:hypothetical protein